MDLPARAAYDLPERRCRWATYKDLYGAGTRGRLDIRFGLLCISPSLHLQCTLSLSLYYKLLHIGDMDRATLLTGGT